MKNARCLLVFVLLFIFLPMIATQENATNTVIKSVGQATTSAMPESKNKSVSCRFCVIKKMCEKVVGFAKRHPLALAAGCTVVVTIVIYNLMPGIKEKIDTMLGKGSPYQYVCTLSETHTMPQEKLDERDIKVE